MKAMMRAIARMLRAMKRAAAGTVKVMVRVGDKLVAMIVPAPLPPMDMLEDDMVPANDNPVATAMTGSIHSAIRNLAYARMLGRLPTAAELGAVSAMEQDWIAAMDAEMNKKLLRASDAEISAHIRGRACIKGVLAFDADAIDDLATARMIEETGRLEQALDLGRYREPANFRGI